MINFITKKDEPGLFSGEIDLTEFEVDSIRDHRRGSSFYETIIIELVEDDREYFPNVKDFSKYIGFWKTNTYVWDDNWGADELVSSLTRVKGVEETIIVKKWVEVK